MTDIPIAHTAFGRWLARGGPVFRRRLTAVYLVLAILNVGAWGWALLAFHDHPVLLGVALVTYGLGLRHAVDADHIAAIDNVTRKLMQTGQRPVAVGFFFAIGHASVVILTTAAVAGAAAWLATFRAWQTVGGLVSTSVSAFFLLAVAAMNLAIFVDVHARYRRLRAGDAGGLDDLDVLLGGRGLLSRLMRPLFALITRGWQMFGLGLLFGLGFDTATEVAVFGVSATQASHGLPLATVMIFPLLFTAGMALVDTTDGVLMLGAYDWAFVKPVRKLYYNMVITLVSAAVAVLIGGAEALALLQKAFRLDGPSWSLISAVTDNMNMLGIATIVLFLGSWLVSMAVYKLKRIDETPS